MITLSNFGWDENRALYYQSLNTQLLPGRIISIKGFKYYVIAERGELETELSGRLLFETENENLPKVGDWVLFQDYESMGYIVDLLPRTNALSRKTPGTKVERQILAANVDCALVVQGLDRDFNIMRLERYLVQVSSCDVEPVIVLNKADLVDNTHSFLHDISKLRRECRVIVCSTVTSSGMDDMITLLEAGKTYMMIGSSGVGKSSLLNFLMNKHEQSVGAISVHNHKGKHTTTSRELFALPNGALMIDTPGMREFGVTFEEDSADQTVFPEIARLASTCRYNDCKHVEETGCAVLAALTDGSLNHVVYESYMKLLKEQRRFQITADEKKRMNKQFGKITREAKDHRRKYKY